MPPSHSEEYRVPFGETDAAGVVFYPNYYRWFDRMSHELLRSLGHPLADYMESGQAPVLAETGATFRHSLHYDELVALKATVASVGTRSFRVEHEVSRNGEVVAHGYEVRIWVEFTADGVHPTPIPASIRQSLTGE